MSGPYSKSLDLDNRGNYGIALRKNTQESKEDGP
jgi:hypothetical protein